MIRLILLLCLLAAPALAAAMSKIEFKDDERVVFLGNEFFDHERDQCYIETLLATRFPEKNLTFRNLGYSGDTVLADARTLCSGWDQFGPPDQGFERLKKLVGEIKPTLIFVAYGMNESFEGGAGLQRFGDGLNRMLDMLNETGARVVLVSPVPHENLGPPLPDPAAHNRDLARYSEAIKETASRRSMPFIDLMSGMAEQSPPSSGNALTSDGIHLTPTGYRRAAAVVEQQMGYPPRAWGIHIGSATGDIGATGIAVKDLAHSPDQVTFSCVADELPAPRPMLREETPTLQVRNLRPGDYSLAIDGRPIATATAQEWAQGVHITGGPDADQTESLRKLIVEKNFDFFNFWRPQNDTYIFGYRKHEQGRNAVEVPKFEEMIPAREAEIAKLRVPIEHKYVVEKSEKKG